LGCCLIYNGDYDAGEQGPEQNRWKDRIDAVGAFLRKTQLDFVSVSLSSIKLHDTKCQGCKKSIRFFTKPDRTIQAETQ